MAIMCGTDFSENADMAAGIAGAIAKAFACPLKLVHAVEHISVATATRREVYELLCDALQRRLGAQAEELQARFGVEVEPVLANGAADEALVALAGALPARLVVVSSLGARKQHRWLLGSVAERVAQSSTSPVLVVRDGWRIAAWAAGEAALRVMVGVEPTPACRAALRWVDELRAIGSCELLVAQIVWPAATADTDQRVGISAPLPLDHLRPEVEQALVRDLQKWADEHAGPGARSHLIRPGWGRVDGHLTQLAAESEVDLLVVGAHQRAGLARLWQGSVSRGVLHGASMSVASVPLSWGQPNDSS
jgi:nucleotide-binding universal stress UspA family protein